MGTNRIVLMSPNFNQNPGLLQRIKDLPGQKLIEQIQANVRGAEWKLSQEDLGEIQSMLGKG
jgi:hypothetical protein